MKGMLTVADILSQSEMKALNPAPRILPAVLEENTKTNNGVSKCLSHHMKSKWIY